MMSRLSEVLSQEDLTRLMEDTGLSSQEIATEYEKAIVRAKSDSNPKKAVNRRERRRQERMVKQATKLAEMNNANRPVADRFNEMSPDEQKDIYWRILEKVKIANAKIAKEEETKENEGLS